MSQIEISKEVFTDHNKIELQDQMLAQDISRKLDKHYPGHVWAVNVNSDGGVVTIKNFAISYLYGFLLKLDQVQNDPTRKSCIMAAGEILERASFRVGGARIGETAKKVDGVAEKHQPKADGKIIV